MASSIKESEASEDTGDPDKEGGWDSWDKSGEGALGCWGYIDWERASR